MTRIRLTRAQIATMLRSALGRNVACRQIRLLKESDLASVYGLTCTGGLGIIAKLAEPGDDCLERERRNLNLLNQRTDFPCPELLGWGKADHETPFDYFLMSRCPGVTLSAAMPTEKQANEIDSQLAIALLHLHGHEGDSFGILHADAMSDDWGSVFVPRMAELRGDMVGQLSKAALRNIDKAIELAEAIDWSAAGPPVLTHGDVWRDNIIVVRTAAGWDLSGIIDVSGMEFAPFEYELAYIEAFDTAGNALFDTYTREQPLPDGYQERRLFYWLHAYMTHVWLYQNNCDREQAELATWTAKEIVHTC